MKKKTLAIVVSFTIRFDLFSLLYGADFAIFPKHTARMVSPPNLTWTPADDDLFVLLLVRGRYRGSWLPIMEYKRVLIL